LIQPVLVSKKNNRGEHLLYTDIKVEDKTFRIFATHLQSVHFGEKEYESLSNLKHAHESDFSDSRTIVSKLKKGYVSRYKQAELVSEKIKESPYQSLICGDFNDVPNSSTYFKIKGNFQDAFLQKGFFVGRSFRFISPTLRIDYILADKKFNVTQFQRIKVPYSDHYPVEADLEY
jgi:endonuclease/exonuclease/phosphatase family metal-dependent hydrolase